MIVSGKGLVWFSPVVLMKNGFDVEPGNLCVLHKKIGLLNVQKADS
jgi:hypothetical protein